MSSRPEWTTMKPPVSSGWEDEGDEAGGRSRRKSMSNRRSRSSRRSRRSRRRRALPGRQKALAVELRSTMMGHSV
jgi:hypothetical protein